MHPGVLTQVEYKYLWSIQTPPQLAQLFPIILSNESSDQTPVLVLCQRGNLFIYFYPIQWCLRKRTWFLDFGSNVQYSHSYHLSSASPNSLDFSEPFPVVSGLMTSHCGFLLCLTSLWKLTNFFHLPCYETGSGSSSSGFLTFILPPPLRSSEPG